MISRSAPSYSPTERARSTALVPAWHCAQRDWGLGTWDWVGLASGSPHLSHTGGVIGRTNPQHAAHTQPDNGSSRSALHTAHTGASTAATKTLAPPGIRDLGWGIRSSPGIRDAGLGIGPVTGCHAFAFRRASSDSSRPCSIFPIGSRRTTPLFKSIGGTSLRRCMTSKNVSTSPCEPRE